MDKEKHEHHEEHIFDLDEPIEEDSLLKKIFIWVVGISLVVLMISYSFVTFPIGDIIKGQIESNPLEKGMIELDDFSIVFEEGTDKQLNELYLEQQDVEFSACLQGRLEDGVYHIFSLYQPVMYEQTFNHVSFEPCSAETLILLHTHPYKSCIASDTDLNTLQKTKERNPLALMVVMCEPARFSVYG